MRPFILDAKEDTPKVVLDKKKGIFEFSGNSLPEDSREFYAPIINWFERYFEDPNGNTLLKFKMDYLNTSSTKIVADLIYNLSKYKDQGINITIEWYYEPMDIDMKQLGNDISYVSDMPFTYKELLLNQEV